MVSIWLFVIGNFLFFAPIFISVYSVIDLKNCKTHFCFKVFGLPLLGGYITIFLNNVCLHISEKKVILLSADNMVEPRSLFNANFCSLLCFRIIGATNLYDSLYLNVFLFTLQTIFKSIASVFKIRKPYLNIKNDLYFKEKFNERVFFLKIGAVTNLFTINLFLTKKFLEMLCKTKKTISKKCLKTQ